MHADFFLDQTHVAGEVVSINNHENGYMDLVKFLFICIKQLKQKRLFNKTTIGLGQKIRIFNTNLYPLSYIGLLIQSVAIRLFNNNYNYIMHALTSLQRDENGPLCVGAVLNPEEADKHFPGFSFTELI